MEYIYLRSATGLLVAIALAFRGLKKKSLDRSGALAAAFVGFFSFASNLRSGLLLILFYLSSSKLTKWKHELKLKLDADYKPGGERNWVQVLSASLFGTILSMVHFLIVEEDSAVFQYGSSISHRKLMCGILGFYATCCSDTWASEIGILNHDWPLLITTFKPVPPGTNGGVSLSGLMASAAGGFFIGFSFWLSGILLRFNSPWEDIKVIPFSTIMGLLGSLLDSILGATLQETYYDMRWKMIVKAPTQEERYENPNVKHVCGVNRLDNQQISRQELSRTWKQHMKKSEVSQPHKAPEIRLPLDIRVSVSRLGLETSNPFPSNSKICTTFPVFLIFCFIKIKNKIQLTSIGSC